MLHANKGKELSVQHGENNGIYQIGAGKLLLGAKRRVLEGAVPPISGAPDATASAYGWVSKALPTPKTGGSYLVEFLSQNEVRVLAYVDPFGRAFTTDEPSATPPARQPDLSFAKFTNQPADGAEEGCVYVRSADGAVVEAARYRCARDKYVLLDSWYDFGAYASGLPYEDALARAYLAFVHRPSLGGSVVPERGLRSVHARLRGSRPLAGMRAIVEEARAAKNDPVVRPPALVRCLAQWLEDAGLDKLAEKGVGDGALRVVRTVRYANTYYLAIDEENAKVPERTVWALEAALNRFLLVEEALGEDASTATEAACASCDAHVIETVGVQRPGLGQLADAPEGAEAGEWALRCAIAGALERLRLPVRAESAFRADAEAGTVAFEMIVPDGSFMPRLVWSEVPGAPGTWADALEESRAAQARRYALHLGLVLASVAFEASPAVRRVDLAAFSISDEPEGAEVPDGGEFPQEAQPVAVVRATFGREAFQGFDGFKAAREADPLPPYEVCGAEFDVQGVDAFAAVEELPSASLRRDLPETQSCPLTDAARQAFGATECADVRINFDTALRRVAEGLADRIVRASNATEAIRIVRAAQEAAAVDSAVDDRMASSCTRLMAALAEGALDVRDQNAIVGSFLGEDRCLAALGRAGALAQRDQEAAVEVLVDAVAEAAALDGFVDGAATVYRTFDSYAGRVLYNRARLGAGQPVRAANDADKRVALASDSFYLCHLEIVRLLERSFERIDEALRYGQRAVAIAPTTAAGYRQLGRAYMLVGDMENAADTLRAGLRVAVQPNDIAMLYYQLAYVLWKAGRGAQGAACYVKSVAVSSIAALQATAELQELVEETGANAPSRDEVDARLAEAGVPVAPTEEVLAALGQAAAVAVDAGLFPVARNLLAIRMRYRPDDALVNVLRSLESSPA